MSSFRIASGQELTPLNITDPEQLTRGVKLLSENGIALFGQLHDELRDDGQVKEEVWAERIADIILPPLGEIVPAVSERSYGYQGRRQTHRAGFHMDAHYDPRFRDPIFFGETTKNAAELRSSIGHGRDFRLNAEKGTLWVMAGPSLVGGKGTWHELGRPARGADRNVTIGAIIPKKGSRELTHSRS